VLQFVCECDVVKDTGKEEYLRPIIHIELDWIDSMEIIEITSPMARFQEPRYFIQINR